MPFLFRKSSLTRTQLTINERNALLTFKKRITSSLRRKVCLVQLFGSKARGDARPDSDIDVLVVVQRWTPEVYDFIYDVVVEVFEKYDVYLSVKVFSQEEYERLKGIPTVFFQLVSRDALPI